MKGAKGCKYWFKEKLVNSKLDNLEKNGQTTHMIYDPMIFSKIKAILGGKLRLMLCNSGSISPEILKFLKICFCVDICEAYGLTEAVSVSCMSLVGDT